MAKKFKEIKTTKMLALFIKASDDNVYLVDIPKEDVPYVLDLVRQLQGGTSIKVAAQPITAFDLVEQDEAEIIH